LVSAANLLRAGYFWLSISDQLFYAQKIRAFALVDDFRLKCVSIGVDFALKAADVVAMMTQLIVLCGTPKRLQFDNASEIISHALDTRPISMESH
jgi:putative transposase